MKGREQKSVFSTKQTRKRSPSKTESLDNSLSIRTNVTGKWWESCGLCFLEPVRECHAPTGLVGEKAEQGTGASVPPRQ